MTLPDTGASPAELPHPVASSAAAVPAARTRKCLNTLCLSLLEFLLSSLAISSHHARLDFAIDRQGEAFVVPNVCGDITCDRAGTRCAAAECGRGLRALLRFMRIAQSSVQFARPPKSRRSEAIWHRLVLGHSLILRKQIVGFRSAKRRNSFAERKTTMKRAIQIRRATSHQGVLAQMTRWCGRMEPVFSRRAAAAARWGRARALRWGSAQGNRADCLLDCTTTRRLGRIGQAVMGGSVFKCTLK
jgi:hypothetical protein